MSPVLRNFALVFVAVLAGLFVFSKLSGRKNPVPPLQQVQDFGVGQIRARRDALTEGFRLADSAKTAWSEYYSNTGKLPTGNDEVGLQPAAAYHGKSTRALAVSEAGVTVTYDKTTGVDGGRVLFEAQPHADTGSVTWRCVTASYRDIKMLVPSCEYTGQPAP
jgi:hypothetical protein